MRVARLAVEAPDRHRVTVREADRMRLRDADSGLGRQRHRGVLDQRHIGRLTVRELDDPLLAGDVSSALGRAPPKRHAR